MTKPAYPTAPIPSDKMPPGIPYIVGNEAAERFSFYGMAGILSVFMTKYLLDDHGNLAPMSEQEATACYHWFTAAVYFFPVLGGILADAFWGKYRTIVTLSLVYCLGHVALAIDETRLGLFTGLILIAVGAGGIKSCVSAHVGDQFGPRNGRLIERVFGWFYFAINVGSGAATFLMPWLLDKYGPGLAFAVPGIFMALATLFFFMGRYKFAHIPAGGIGFVKEALSGEGLRVLGRLAIVYLFVAPFWALFNQIGSTWVFQASRMDRHWLNFEWLRTLEAKLCDAGFTFVEGWTGAEPLPAQIQTANPVLILILIPLFAYCVYPLINRVFRLTPLRKISLGLFLAVLPFSLCALIEIWIERGGRPNILWQMPAYVLLTSAEVMVSITCLEFSYTQAPKKMKSLVMGLFLCSMSLGNAITWGVTTFLQNDDGTSKISWSNYFWFFTAMMLITAVLFVGAARLYKGRTYIQDEADGSGE